MTITVSGWTLALLAAIALTLFGFWRMERDSGYGYTGGLEGAVVMFLGIAATVGLVLGRWLS